MKKATTEEKKATAGKACVKCRHRRKLAEWGPYKNLACEVCAGQLALEKIRRSKLNASR